MTWIFFAPELTTLLMAAVFFTFSMARKSGARSNFFIAVFLSALCAVAALSALGAQGVFFAHVYQLNLFSQLFKVLLALGLFLVVCLCSDLRGIEERQHPECYLLLSISTLGTMMMVSSVDLLTLYVSLEVSSYSLYLLVALRKGEGTYREAGIKYMLTGAATSAAMLFGLALLLGAISTTNLVDLQRVLASVMSRPLFLLGLLLTLSGFFFKLALFPFHIWAPTVYQGAANQVAAYIATATKAAAAAVLVRLVASAGESNPHLVRALVILAIASMTFGNLVALRQKDLKRLFAYSAVAHAGYILIGILSTSEKGYAGAIFYAFAYLTMTYACFLVLVKVARDGGNLTVDGLAGLHRRSPLMAMTLLLGVFSLGGIPPTVGFTGKFLVFVAALDKDLFYLVLIGMINVVVSLYYYALIVKAAYLTPPKEAVGPIVLSPAMTGLTLLIALIIVVGGLFPGPLYELALAATRVLVLPLQ
jgi:NADH-quinone oxidoreductase subunit N